MREGSAGFQLRVFVQDFETARVICKFRFPCDAAVRKRHGIFNHQTRIGVEEIFRFGAFGKFAQ